MPSKTKPPPRVVVFAGPNGAGKSTHADAILAALGIETQLTITETATWHKLQKLSKVV